MCKVIEDRRMPERRVPLDITAAQDPFYSESNIRYLKGKLDALNARMLPLETYDLIEDD